MVSQKSPSAITYQMKITLAGVRPPIWRRIRVPGAMTFGDLHSIIQVAFGWTDSHLHEFEIDGENYGNDPENGALDERKYRLRRVLGDGPGSMRYTYDFGDDWQHNIIIEKAEAARPGDDAPMCLAGKRNGPPEDCGGAWGYMELLAVLKGPEDERQKELKEWLGAEFDPEEFSIQAINQMLAA